MRGLAIASLRSLFWRALCSSGSFLDRQPTQVSRSNLVASHPFDYLAFLEIQETPELVLTPNQFPWWSDLQHKLAVFLAVLRLVHNHRDSAIHLAELSAYRQNIYNETIRFCTDVIKPSYPTLAHKLVTKVVEVLYSV